MKKIKITKKHIKDFLTINLGVFLMAMAYSILIDRNKLVIGGVGGIATILSNAITGLKINSSFIILIINVVLLLIALIFVGKKFFLKTLYTSLIYPVYVFMFEKIILLLQDVVPDLSLTKEELAIKLSDIALGQNAANAIMAGSYLLVIIFGAVISGFGLGLALKKGASTGGVDIIQQILLDRFKIPFSISLLMIDGTIVTVAAIYFKDFFMILYGFLFIYLSGVVLDAIVFSGFNSRAVYIITSDPEAVKNKIYSVLERGVTEIYSRGGYRQEDKKMLVCVMSNNEFYKMKTLILEIDKRAFIFVARVSEVHGEGFTYDSPEQVEKENEPSK
ncbi:MAG: YitT family protein [Acholeplasmatales bacterium]|jgi:uncharacterized membrane-anchored protein YitT (DUF2179 family)|nr:YitT family protein [Acholeplasmatales bacterium]MDD7395718.1 YitT family protein [Acholeplasmatales bacterium]MDY4017180.1 YitT family protein [Bacilli bacterium]CDD22077.1 yitT family protein [Firmicutes bacterium CAG:313]HCX07585.1 YitT family protein [Acholeplasmatales bacterium]